MIDEEMSGLVSFPFLPSPTLPSPPRKSGTIYQYQYQYQWKCQRFDHFEKYCFYETELWILDGFVIAISPSCSSSCKCIFGNLSSMYEPGTERHTFLYRIQRWSILKQAIPMKLFRNTLGGCMALCYDIQTPGSVRDRQRQRLVCGIG